MVPANVPVVSYDLFWLQAADHVEIADYQILLILPKVQSVMLTGSHVELEEAQLEPSRSWFIVERLPVGIDKQGEQTMFQGLAVLPGPRGMSAMGVRLMRSRI